MVNRKTASALTIAALLTCAVPIKSRASALMSPLLGQAVPTFPVPNSVEKGTEITVSSSSDNMNAISAALRQGFENTYANSQVIVETKDANAAIQDVLNGNADLAAISRPLTVEEKQKGLIAIPVRREKIAIVVDKDNPFSKSITGSQFAQIFRGEINNWSAVGGPDSAIKLIDRPASSETRQALSPYPVFTTVPFKAASGATTLESDTPEALVAALGTNGIGYVLVGELAGQPELRALPLHQTPPSDPKYPFSQPYSFVYAGGASPAVSAFLGYATGNPGQAVVNDAGAPGIGLMPNATGGAAGGTAATAGNATGTATGGTTGSTAGNAGAGNEGSNGTGGSSDSAADTSGSEPESGGASLSREVDSATLAAAGVAAGPDGIFGTADDIDIAGPDGVFGTADDVDIAGPDGIVGTDDDIEIGPAEAEPGVEGTEADGELANKGRWWWLLLPLAGLGLLIWAASKTSSEEKTGYVASADLLEGDRTPSTYKTKANESTPELKSGSSSANLSSVEGDTSKGISQNVNKTVGTKITDPTASSTIGLAAADKASDVTANLQESDIQGDITSIKGVESSGIDGTSGQVRGGIDSSRGSIDSGIEGSSIEGSGIEGSGIEGSRIDSTGDRLQETVDSPQTEGSSWLDRAKQRINEATEQAKDAAADIKDDMTDSR